MIRFGLVLLVALAAGAQATNDWDAHEVEGFVDGLMAAQKNAYNFAGAVVVIVRNGQVALAKGYGYSDFAARRPVDPKRTVFRVDSNTKMFVWTSVMQLVEQGKLDLHTDVNKYLRGVQVPPTFAAPVTLEHLMSHTAGFDGKFLVLFSKTPEVRSLASLMKSEMPRRILPPGKVPAYSSYGASLAALIVEQVSGARFEEYVRTRILEPLGMKHSTLAQPVPNGIAADLSKGYRLVRGGLQEAPFEYVWAPSGGMSTSGEDMAWFMMAHLNEGVLGAARILRPETARAMRQKLPSFSPRINGMLHGFIEMNWNGETILGHGGTGVAFFSLTAMLPARRLGVFVAYNTDSAAPARDQFLGAFLDHYFPNPLAHEPPPQKNPRVSLERFSGTYSHTMFTQPKWLKLPTSVCVGVNSDGYLVTSQAGPLPALSLDNVRWRQVEPLIFREVDGRRQLVFREDERGQVQDFCTSPMCFAALQKEPWWNSRGLQLTWIGICAAILVCALVGLPIAAVLERRQANPACSKLAHLTAWLASASFSGGAAMIAIGMQDPNSILLEMPGIPPAIRAGLTLWLVQLFLSIGLVIFTVSAWRRKWWRMAGRVWLTVVCLASIGATLWLYGWDLLG